MALRFIERYPLIAYTGLAYLWTWLACLPQLLNARGAVDLRLPHELEALCAFGPFVAAMLVLRATEGAASVSRWISGLTRVGVGAGGQLLAVGSPVAILMLAALVVYLRTGAAPDHAGLAQSPLATMGGWLQLILVGALLQALGEEPGWRGLMLPRLRSRFGLLAATLLLYPVWLLWHLPMFLSRPDFGLAQWLGFSLGILAAAVWLTWVWEATRSILMAVLWHAMINVVRGVALAVSAELFVAFNLVVAGTATAIVVSWVVTGRRRVG